MEPLRAEHRELLPNIQSIERVARDVLHADPEVMRSEVESVLEFLKEHLLIHAMAEDDVLYPAVERAMGAPDATATMRRDHREVAALIDELASSAPTLGGELTDEQRTRIAALLFGLRAIVALHFAKEEEIYVPLLDRTLTVDEGRALLEEMEQAAERHRAELA